MKEDKYSFVVFLLDDYDDIYKDLKVHSLCHNGYVSQVVKFNSLKKNAMSVCSKILLQINSKLSGVSYMLKLGDDIKKRKYSMESNSFVNRYESQKMKKIISLEVI